MARPSTPGAPMLLALLVTGASGCSLLGLGHYEVGKSCRADAECAPLNARDALSDGDCRAWRCVGADTVRDGRCVSSDDADGDAHASLACGGDDCDDGAPAIHPGAPESCDGTDEDCDGAIDDGALFGALSPVLAVRDGTSATLSLSADGVGDVLVAVRGIADADPGVARIDVGAGTRVDTQSLEVVTRNAQGQVVADCPEPEGARADCQVRSLATSSAVPDARLGLASLAVDQCAAGQLRVGIVSEALDQLVLPLAPTSAPFGIDTGTTGIDCTGVSRVARGLPSHEGATRVALAAHAVAPSDDVVAQGLGVFVGDSDASGGRPRCASSGSAAIASVEAIGIWEEITQVDGARAEVSGDGIPLALGFTEARGAPAVLALDAPEGFVVGFASETAVVDVRFFGPLAPLPRARSATPPLAAPIPLATIAADLTVDDVALAEGRTHDDVVDVAVLASFDCGARLTFHVVGVSVGGVTDAAATREVPLGFPALADAGPPALLHLDAGVRPAGAGEPGGGFVVAIAGRDPSEPSGTVALYVVRVPDATGAALPFERYADAPLVPHAVVTLVADAMDGHPGLVAATTGTTSPELATTLFCGGGR